MDLIIDKSGLSRAAGRVIALPGVFRRAKQSALKSTGWMIRGEMRDFIESAGDGTWPGRHPLSATFFKKYKMGISRWGRSKKTMGPMFWLGRFSRYRVTDDMAVIGFGKSHGSKASKAEREAPATINPFLMSVLRRAEQGENTLVTKSMRRFFGATRKNNSKSQMAGRTFFPLRASTKVLETPKRPIFGPVMARIQNQITPHFEDRFWLAVTRYREGAENKR